MFYSRAVVYPRSNIKAVFRAHNGTFIGLGVGAAVGGTIGAAKSECCRTANALVGAALIGAIGAVVGTALDPFFHGKSVYRSASQQSGAAPKTHEKRMKILPGPKRKMQIQTVENLPCLRDGATLQCVQ